jgi:hypothetical protein
VCAPITAVDLVREQVPDETKVDPAQISLVPRFTIRTLLVILTVCAVIFVMIGTATRGQSWAWGVTIGILSVIIVAITHAAWFGIARLFLQMSQDKPQISESELRQVMASLQSKAAPDVGPIEQSPSGAQSTQSTS